MKTIAVTITAAAIFIVSARGQAFQNLDFESANNLPVNPPLNGTEVAAANALPDWTAYSGPAIAINALSTINYVSNELSGFRTSVELEGGSLALSGEFSAELYLNSALGQTGLVPANAGSLQFEAEGPGGGGSLGGTGFSVALGGQTLSYSAVSTGPGYTVYAANIPAAMDALTETLTFSCQGAGSGEVALDDINFVSVPEPSEWALMAVGAFTLVAYRRRK